MLLQIYCMLHVRLPVIGAEQNRVAVEELVQPSGCFDERPHRRVGALERGARAVRAEHV